MTATKRINGQRTEVILSDARIKFWDIDRLIVHKFDANIFSKIDRLFEWLEEQKSIAKQIICNETGRIRLPKTPKRYCLLPEAQTLQRCRKNLFDSIPSQRKDAFTNRNNPHYELQTPKSSKHPITRTIKVEPLTDYTVSNPKTPIRPVPAPRMHLPTQQTLLKINKLPSIQPAEQNTPMRTPVMKAVLKNTLTPKGFTQQPTIKRSEVIRKMETRTNTVLRNKEELMKEKAERARRDREERALRVKMNNKKKEEEAQEKLRIIKMRERQIEAMKQQQRAPQRAISKSPCRTRGYYNRTQKQLVRALSSQDLTVSKSVFQVNVTNNDQKGNHQLHGKRNHSSNIVKNDSDGENKRQKLDRVKISGGSSKRLTKTSTLRDVTNNYRASSHAGTEKSASKDNRSSGIKGRSESSVHTAIEAEEAPVAKESTSIKKTRSGAQQQKKSFQIGTINNNVVMESLVARTSKAHRESVENMNGQIGPNSMDASVDISTVKDGTFETSMDISCNQKWIGDNDYNVDNLSSNDETDDEDNPRKPVPLWAQGERLSRTLRKQVSHSRIDVDTYFGPVRIPKLDRIFAQTRARYNKRTSSAQWSSPLTNPKIGKSRFFELQNTKRADKP